VSEPALSLTALRVRYRDGARDALAGIDLELGRGEMVGVIGATGAGKSTLLKCARRIVPEMQAAEVSGAVAMFGRSIADRPVNELAGDVGIVFQDFEAQLFSTRVSDEILFGLEQIGVPPSERLALVETALAEVGLAGFEERDPLTLSGGEKQRLALAAVLAARPGLLLLDEPSTDLDPAGRRDLFSVFARLRSSGISLLIAEHDLDRLAAADRLVALHDGRIAFGGTPEEVFARSHDLAALGVRAPDLALVCAALRLPTWPIDVLSVESRMRAAGITLREAPPRASEPGEVLLEARDVRHRYAGASRDALAGVSATLRKGEFVALVGSNGSGKSTLARCMAGLVAPGGGAVRFRGRPVADLPARERIRVGMVFQNPDEQIFASSVEDEIAFGPREIGLPSDEVARRVAGAIGAFGLEGLEHRDPFLLGKGDRQRVAIASVVVLEPDVLVLDEPTTGLDAREQQELMGLLERLNERGVTIVVITHVSWVVARYAKRAILLADGRILFDGSVRELFSREDVCAAGDFLPTEAARLARALGSSALTADELLAAC
jgi:energy-coupling factor transport system ATP-binding protein